MAIYTRSGDGGETSLAGGDRVNKADPRVEAYGTIDEANCFVGLARAASSDEDVNNVLRFAQQRLSNCAALIATPAPSRHAGSIGPSEEDTAFLERAIDAFDDTAGDLRGFVLPGGSELAARLHVARAVVRRAERRVVALAPRAEEDLNVLQFLNRLSDLLFSAARCSLARAGVAEESWDAT